MKVGTLIKVVDNKPLGDAQDIQCIVGNTYNVTAHWKQKRFKGIDLVTDNKMVWIECVEFGGEIALSKEEYCIVS